MLDAETTADGLAKAMLRAAKDKTNMVVHIGNSTTELYPKERADTVVTTRDMTAIAEATRRKLDFEQIRGVLAAAGIAEEKILNGMSDADLAERLRRAFDY